MYFSGALDNISHDPVEISRKFGMILSTRTPESSIEQGVISVSTIRGFHQGGEISFVID